MTSEFFVNPGLFHKKGVYLVKEELTKNEKLIVKSGIKGAQILTSIVETLQRLNYIKIIEINTSTTLYDGKRRINLIYIVQKTSDFDKIYQENVEKRNKFIEENKNHEQKN